MQEYPFAKGFEMLNCLAPCRSWSERTRKVGLAEEKVSVKLFPLLPKYVMPCSGSLCFNKFLQESRGLSWVAWAFKQLFMASMICAAVVLAGCRQACKSSGQNPSRRDTCPEELSTKVLSVAHMRQRSRSPYWCRTTSHKFERAFSSKEYY